MDNLKNKGLIPEQFYELAVVLLDALKQELGEMVKKRWNIWKGTTWEDTPENGKLLLRSIEKAVKGKSNGIEVGQVERYLLLQGQLNRWNLNVLTSVLYNVPEMKSASHSHKDSWALKLIWDLNELVVNRPKPQMENVDYTTFISSLKRCIKILHIEEIKMIQVFSAYMDTVMSAKDLSLLKEQLAPVRNEMLTQNYQKALSDLSTALEISPLLHDSLKLHIYKLRMICLKYWHILDVIEMCDNKNTQALVRDAVEVIRLDPGNYDAHHCLYLYSRNKDTPYHSVYHYNRMTTLDLYTILSKVQNVIVALNLRNRKDNCYGLLEKGCSKSIEMMVTLNELSSFSAPAQTRQEDVAFVHKMKATIEIFHKAAKKENELAKFAYATHVFAFYTHLYTVVDDYVGIGFENSVKLHGFSLQDSVTILQKISKEKCEPHFFGDDKTEHDSVRIGLAKFILGVLYDYGQFLGRNSVEAEKWYKRAAIKHNIPEAAFNLGTMYITGATGATGIPSNIPLAKLYLQQAVVGNHPMAISTMTNVYLNQFLEIAVAERFVRVSKVLLDDPNGTLERYESWFAACFLKHNDGQWNVKMNQLENIIQQKFEKPFNLSTKGLTFLERVKRAELMGMQYNVGDLMEATEYNFRSMPAMYTPREKKWESDRTTEYGKMINDVQKKLWITYGIITSDKRLTRRQMVEVCNNLYSSFESSPTIKLGLQMCSYFDKEARLKLSDIMRTLATSEEGEAEKKAKVVLAIFQPEKRIKLKNTMEYLGVKTNNSPTLPLARVCCADFLWMVNNSYSGLEEIISFLEVGVKEHPSHLSMKYLLGEAYSQMFFKKNEEVEQHKLEGLESKKDKLMIDANYFAKKAISTFQDFLKKSPLENPLCVLASYSLACLHITLISLFELADKLIISNCMTNSSNNGNCLVETSRKGILEAYKMGVKSEKQQLSCYPISTAGKHLKRKIEVYINKHMYHDNADEIIRFEDLSYRYLLTRQYLLCPRRIFSMVGLRYRLKEQYRKPLPCKMKLLVKYKTESWIDFMTRTLSGINKESPSNWLKKQLSFVTSFIPSVNQMNVGYIKLTIIDEVFFATPLSYLLTEDHEGNIVPVAIDYGASIMRISDDLKLEFGTTLVIINARYVLLNSNGENVLRVGGNEKKCEMILTGRVSKMCRFCGNADAVKQCTNCRRHYCSVECQRKDAKIMKHKYICGV